jgi:hypothetical protein
MSDLFYRTEDIKPDDVQKYFVETQSDRDIINALKGHNPIILSGSRGVGKSFLLRVAEAELTKEMGQNQVFPVYLSFSKSSLIITNVAQQFQHWMLARICSRLVRALEQGGHVGAFPKSVSILSGGGMGGSTVTGKLAIERIADAFEESWKQPAGTVDLVGLPSIDAFKDAVEDLCRDLRLRRVVFLIDEAAHIFLAEQQRQFFTLFRDLRSPYISCKAAVYPGVTSYGDTFQPIHDATMLSLERDVLGPNYVATMREIVEKQAESRLMAGIASHEGNFRILAYAASGNPRVLLKTIAKAPRVAGQQVNEVIREYYRTDIWAEHSTLPEKYAGHRTLIDWGRRFIENEVLPDLQRKNAQYLENQQSPQSTCFFWIHRDVPQPVKEALRLLAYTGIVREHASGIKATRSEIGTRYAVNVGCLFALEATPTTTALRIARHLTPKRMSEFGANHSAYHALLAAVPTLSEADVGEVLRRQLSKSIRVLDITAWQRDQLLKLGLMTVGDVLHASETKLQERPYVGEVRSRRMRNAAIAAVYEYLSG